MLEKTKLKRQLKKKLKEIEQEENESARLDLEKEKAEIIKKINYIKMYPKDKKYISLFPKNTTNLDEKAQNMQNSIMESIEKQISAIKNKKYTFSSKPTETKSSKTDAFFLETEPEFDLSKNNITRYT